MDVPVRNMHLDAVPLFDIQTMCPQWLPLTSTNQLLQVDEGSLTMSLTPIDEPLEMRYFLPEPRDDRNSTIESLVIEKEPLQWDFPPCNLDFATKSSLERFGRFRMRVSDFSLSEVEVCPINSSIDAFESSDDAPELPFYLEFAQEEINPMILPDCPLTLYMDSVHPIPVMDHCFPVFSYTKRDTFLESLCCPILQFSIASSLPYEPLTKEWLMELDISTEEAFIELNEIPEIHYCDLEYANRVTEEIIPRMLEFTEKRDLFENSHNFPTEAENEFSVPELPVTCEFNTQYFDADDIYEFAGMFPGIEALDSPMTDNVIFRIKEKAIAFLRTDKTQISESVLVDCCIKYRYVIIISTTAPDIICRRITWRCITSLSKLPHALIPFISLYLS